MVYGTKSTTPTFSWRTSARAQLAPLTTVPRQLAGVPRQLAAVPQQLVVALLLSTMATPLTGQGLVLPSVGPINRSMGGAGVALPLDAIGAIHWNPASITALGSRVDLGIELLYDVGTRASSAVQPGALGPGVPPATVAGSTDNDGTAFPLPTLGVVHHVTGSRWTYGLGIFAIGGFASNLPADNTNPILSAPPPTGLGLGAVYARISILQIAPTFAYALNDELSVGFAPTITVADLSGDPFFFAAPDDANGNGFPSSPSGSNSLPRYGGGIQLGIYYDDDDGIHLGASVKSPQYFETFRFNSADELGQPRSIEAELEYPMIVGFGSAYTGFDKWSLALDARFVDYDHTQLLGEPAEFRADGSLRGLGWRSVWHFAGGAQFQATDELSLRAGYSFNQNPVPNSVTVFNLGGESSIYEHLAHFGFSYQFDEQWSASLSLVHAFSNSISGPWYGTSGALPGTSVRIEAESQAVLFGLGVTW